MYMCVASRHITHITCDSVAQYTVQVSCLRLRPLALSLVREVSRGQPWKTRMEREGQRERRESTLSSVTFRQ